MNLDRAVMAFGGTVVLLGLVLSQVVHPAFVWLSIFAGVMLLQSAFTGLCPAAFVFRKLGLKAGSVFK